MASRRGPNALYIVAIVLSAAALAFVILTYLDQGHEEQRETVKGVYVNTTEPVYDDYYVVNSNGEKQVIYDVYFSNGEKRRDSFLITNETHEEIADIIDQRSLDILKNIA